MPDMEINIGHFKVLHMSGTSSLVVGKASYEELSSDSKTTNGVGSAYGDGSHINMSPYQSSVNDPDLIDKVGGDTEKTYQYPYQDSPSSPSPQYYSFYPMWWPQQDQYPLY